MKKKLPMKPGEQVIRQADVKITPFVKSMTTGISIPADLDTKGEYRKHLIEKYR
jgi:hypothetical protein